MANQLWTVRDVLGWTVERFKKIELPSPRLDAELLLAKALDCQRIMLYVELDRPLDDAERARFRGLVSRRLAREPVAYLVGEREFWSRPFAVDARVLVPRPDTELLVEQGLAALDGVVTPRILDVGTGSGALGVTLALERPDATVLATDLSADALVVAAQNAAALGAEVSFHTGDLLAALPANSEAFQLIVSNPPYVAEVDRPSLAPEVLQEPEAALFAGEDGLDVVRRLVREAFAHLAPGAQLMIEIGQGQAAAVSDLMANADFETPARTHRDLAGIERVVAATRPA